MDLPVMQEIQSIESQAKHCFAHLEQELGARIHSPIHPLRKQALDFFLAKGVPTAKHEEYRYTPFSSKLRHFDLSHEVKNAALAPQEIEKLKLHGIAANVLVFVNGVYSPYHSTILTPVHEMEVLSMDRAEEKRIEAFDQHFGKITNTKGDEMAALNTALSHQGVFVYVPAGQKVALPLVIHHITDTSHGKNVAFPRNLIVLGESAEVTIVEMQLSTGNEETYTNFVTEIHLAESAQCHYYKLQNQNSKAVVNDSTFVSQAGHSISNLVTITTSQGYVRNNLYIALEHSEALANLSGLYYLSGNGHTDNHTAVDHIAPNCESNELYKGVLDEASTAVFNGKIFVQQPAQKTNAFQSNKNILLSNDATVNTKPQLEIFADDVKCSHGCTVGALDEEPLFYLRSRGLDEVAARALLLHAFSAEIIDKIELEPLRALITQIIEPQGVA